MSKMCPKCNKEWPDEFKACPLDGTSLISKPQESAGFSMNLGDANAISGGVNMSDNHSVSNNTVNNTTNNVDSHNVITNHITQVEREKTPEELKHDRELTYREECIKLYRNGIMTSEGKRKLEDLQYQLGIDEDSASRISSEVAKRSEKKSSSLSPVHQITFNNIKTAINANRLDLVNRLMAQLKAMVQRYSVEEIQFTYYMLLAILHPKECIEEYKSHKEDKYWQAFWSSIAYRRVGGIEKSELLVADVGDKWIDTIPQENVFILATINALIDKDLLTAKSLYDNIVGEHSPYLSNLVACLYTLLYDDILSEEELKQMQKDNRFYLDHLFADIQRLKAERNEKQKEVAEAQRLAIEEQRKQEEAEAKRLAEERRINEMKEWSAEEQAQYLCPNGVMPIEEFRELGHKIIDEELDENRITEEQKVIENADENKNASSFNKERLSAYLDDFGYLRKLSENEVSKLKSILQDAPANNYQALTIMGQLYLQENNTAVNQKKAYNALKTASEHGVSEAAAYMAYFYLYGKVVAKDLDEAEQRMKIDDDYKKNPIFIKMLIDLYTDKGNEMLANVWNTKLKKLE